MQENLFSEHQKLYTTCGNGYWFDRKTFLDSLSAKVYLPSFRPLALANLVYFVWQQDFKQSEMQFAECSILVLYSLDTGGSLIFIFIILKIMKSYEFYYEKSFGIDKKPDLDRKMSQIL